MKLRKNLSIAFVGAAICLSVISCDKKTTNPTTETDSDTETASDNNLAESNFNDVQNITDQAATSKTGLIFFLPASEPNSKDVVLSEEKSSCATITHDSVSIPKTITIDFGTTNCVCKDGKTRRGKINVSYTGKYKDSASVHTITFTDYFVNDNQITGTKSVTNNGKNANGNLTFTITVDGSIIKANNGGTVTWKSTRTREWLEGSNTATFLDDVYSITGSSSGTNAKGVSYLATITTPLHRALNCNWFDAGVIEINVTGKALRTINYGSGTCDNQATVTIAGKTYDITLK